jgi:hypothetical protein
MPARRAGAYPHARLCLEWSARQGGSRPVRSPSTARGRERGAGKLGRDILGNAGKAQHLDAEQLPGGGREADLTI